MIPSIYFSGSWKTKATHCGSFPRKTIWNNIELIIFSWMTQKNSKKPLRNITKHLSPYNEACCPDILSSQSPMQISALSHFVCFLSWIRWHRHDLCLQDISDHNPAAGGGNLCFARSKRGAETRPKLVDTVACNSWRLQHAAACHWRCTVQCRAGSGARDSKRPWLWGHRFTWGVMLWMWNSLFSALSFDFFCLLDA